MVSKGTKWPYLTESTRTTTITRIQFGCFKPYTKHPYMLIIPQLLAEDVLGQKLASFRVTVYPLTELSV